MTDSHVDRRLEDPESVDELADRLGRVLAARRHRPRALVRSVALRIGAGVASVALICSLLLVGMRSGRSQDVPVNPAPGAVALPTVGVPDPPDPRGLATVPSANKGSSPEDVRGPAEPLEAQPYAAEKAAPRVPGQ